MNGSVRKILRYRKIYYSQGGEDGVLEYILSKLPDRTNWCVEFGAWDGKFNSNTYHLISMYGYSGVFIEPSPDVYLELRKNMEKYSGVQCFDVFVRTTGENCIDNILKKTDIPKHFDLLSIDIDGNDYHVWKSIAHYEPSVVIIEIQVADGPDKERINDPDRPYGLGTSLLSMTNLARSKGYALVARVECNAIFVKQKYLSLFHDREILPADVFSRSTSLILLLIHRFRAMRTRLS